MFTALVWSTPVRSSDAGPEVMGIPADQLAPGPAREAGGVCTELESQPRIAPGTRGEVGPLNYGILCAVGTVAGGRAPNVFTTLARHRRLFRRWLWFASALMPRGSLDRADTELVVLRVAHNCGSDYEWSHHERIGQRAGLSAAQMARVRQDRCGDGWSELQAALLAAADELHEHRTISSELWDVLHAHLSELQLIELCMLVGHYEMLAMTLNSLGVQSDPISDRDSSWFTRAMATLKGHTDRRHAAKGQGG